MPTSSERASSMIDTGVAPASSARCDACWMSGPSITGSENGMPISIASAPFAAADRTASCHPARPPVM